MPSSGWGAPLIPLLVLAVAPAPALAAPGDVQDQRDAADAAPAWRGDEISYPAAFFAPFGVQTALDVLARTPGFALSQGDDVRGFGGAAGNVLIDGQRPTVKSGGVADVLRRIPAARVARVVLIRGGGLAAEAQGQALIANVILVADEDGSGEAGNVTITFARQRDGRIAPSAELSYGTRFGSWEASGTASFDIDREDVLGRYRILDGGGRLDQVWVEEAPSRSIETVLAGSLTGPLGGGTLVVNARRSQDWFRDRVRIAVRAGSLIGPLLARRSLDFDEQYHEVELGADWTGTAWAGWTAKLVLLVRPSSGRVDQSGVNESGATTSSLGQREFEGVARATLSRTSARGARFELGGEIAENRLTSTLAFAEEVDGVLVDTPLPGSAVSVSELRGETFVNLAEPVGRGLRADLGVAVEWSRIRVAGDLGSERQFIYFKPSAAMIWDIAKTTQARLGIRRTVDQLDFGDFAASVQTVDDRQISGNARLRPARITRASLRLDHRWGDAGAVSADLFYEHRAGVLDFVPTPTGGQAIGDAGDGRIWGLTVQATLPLDLLLADARLTVDATVQRSRLRDPLSGRPRRLSGLVQRDLTLAFRHDWRRLRSSWGVDLVAPRREFTFFVDEIQVVRTSERLAVYAETSQVEGVRITLRASAITGEDEFRRRDFFDQPGSGAATGSQFRRRGRGARLVLSVVRSL